MYGPVRTVVWADGGGDPASDPIFNATLGQQILHVSKAQCEAAIEPHGVLDDRGWEVAVTI